MFSVSRIVIVLLLCLGSADAFVKQRVEVSTACNGSGCDNSFVGVNHGRMLILTPNYDTGSTGVEVIGFNKSSILQNFSVSGTFTSGSIMMQSSQGVCAGIISPVDGICSLFLFSNADGLAQTLRLDTKQVNNVGKPWVCSQLKPCQLISIDGNANQSSACGGMPTANVLPIAVLAGSSLFSVGLGYPVSQYNTISDTVASAAFATINGLCMLWTSHSDGTVVVYSTAALPQAVDQVVPFAPSCISYLQTFQVQSLPSDVAVNQTVLTATCPQTGVTIFYTFGKSSQFLQIGSHASTAAITTLDIVITLVYSPFGRVYIMSMATLSAAGVPINVATFTSSTSSNGLESVILTNSLVGEANIDSLTSVVGGLGWVVCDTLPFIPVMPDSPSSQQWSEVLIDAATWIARFGTTYSAVTLDFHVFLNATTGALATQSTAQIAGARPVGGVQLNNSIPIQNKVQGVTAFGSTFMADGTVLRRILFQSVDAAWLGGIVYIINRPPLITLSVVWGQQYGWQISNSGPIIPKIFNDQQWVAASSALGALAELGDCYTVTLIVTQQLPSKLVITIDVLSDENDVLGTYGTPFTSQTALNSDSTPTYFACSNKVIYAYTGLVGNVSWTYDVSSSTGNCADPDNCMCQGNNTIFIPASRSYIVVSLTSNIPSVGLAPGLIVLSWTGSLLFYTAPTDISDRTQNECGATAFGYLGKGTEITDSIDASGMAVVMSIVNSRCHVVLQTSTNSDEFTITVFELIGAWARYSSEIVYSPGYIVMTDNAVVTTTTGGSGHTYYLLDITQFIQYALLYPSARIVGITPVYTSQGVAVIFANGLLVEASWSQNPSWLLQLSVFKGAILWSAYFPISPELATIDANMFTTADAISGNFNTIFACLSMGNIYCIPAVSVQVSVPSPYVPEVPLWGLPIASMIQEAASFSPIFTFDTSAGPLSYYIYNDTISQYSPAVRSGGSSVNASTCSTLLVSGEALLASCGSVNFPDFNRLTVISIRTGGIVLFDGPPGLQAGSVSVAADGSTITALLQSNTALTWKLATFTIQETPVFGNIDFCSSADLTNFVVSISNAQLMVTSAAWDVVQTMLNSEYPGAIQVSYNQNTMGGGIRLSTQLTVLMESTLDFDSYLPPIVASNLPLTVELSASLRIVSSQTNQVLMDSAYCQRAPMAGGDTFCLMNTTAINVMQLTVVPDGAQAQVLQNQNPSFIPTTMVYPMPYTGNISLSIARAERNMWYAGDATIQCATAQSFGVQSVLTKRYCYSSPTEDAQQWVSIESDGISMAFSTYSDHDSYVSGVRTSYGFPAVSFGTLAYAPSGQIVSIDQFVMDAIGHGSFPETIPKASMTGISSVSQVIISTDGQTLTIVTNVASIDLDNITCPQMDAVIATCPELIPYRYEHSSYRTVYWSSINGSNWGSGFVRTGAANDVWSLPLAQRAGDPVVCGLNFGLCPAECKPSLECSSASYAYYLTWLQTVSWMPAGASVSASPCARDPDYPMLPSEPTMALRCSSNGDVVISTELGGVDYVITTFAKGVTSDLYGVSFICSECLFFILRQVTPMPFLWQLVGIIKFMTLCVVLNYLGKTMKASERVKERLRLQVQAIDDNVYDLQASISQGGDAAEARQQIAQLESKKIDIMKEERKGYSVNLLDSYARALAMLCHYRRPAEVASLARRIRSNILGVSFTDSELVDMLMLVLREDPSNRSTVEVFAEYYRYNLCDGMRWVVRTQLHEVFGVPREKAKDSLQKDLEEVQQSLRDIYAQFASLALHEMPRTEPRPTPASPEEMKEHSTFLLVQLEGRSDRLDSLGDRYLSLLKRRPHCFQYATFPHQKDWSRPPAMMLLLMLICYLVVAIIFTADVIARSDANSRTFLQIYECVFFLMFNSCLPATMIVGSLAHAEATNARLIGARKGTMRGTFTNSYFITSMILLAPALITHVIPGVLMYGWFIIPIFGVAMGAESAFLQATRRPLELAVSSPRDGWRLAGLAISRAIVRLFAGVLVASALSISFNVASAQIWSQQRGNAGAVQGTYISGPYLDVLWDDLSSRSLTCMIDNICSSVSNVVQFILL